MSRGVVAAVLTACAALAVGAWVRLGLPVAVPDAPMTRAEGARIGCVSYAPFRGAETPFDESLVIPRARIAADLRRLADLTGCVRTYAASNGLDQVAAAAKEAGVTVLQGLWIGRDAARNRAEIERVVALATAYPDTISAVIVGNEALLRGEISAPRLAALIDEVRAAIPQPVTYADVWEFWLRHGADLTDSVDFITVHLLPYWEDDPVGIDAALAHVARIREDMAAAFPGKDILIGEIGWPSAGRQRAEAEPSLVNETRFIRGVLHLTDARGWRANLIEAFDQPWKRALEGTAGGAWGLFDADGRPKVTLSGPVVEVPDWWRWLGASVAAGLVIAALAGLLGPAADKLGWLICATGGIASGGVLGFLARHALLSSRNALEWAVNGGVGLLAVAAAVTLLALLRLPAPDLADHLAATPGRLAALLRRLTLVAAAISAIGLVFDARYRDFPATMLAIAAVGTALLALRLRRRDPLPRAIEDPWLATVVAAGAIAVPVLEGPANDDALAWALTALLLAIPALPGRGGRTVPGR